MTCLWLITGEVMHGLASKATTVLLCGYLRKTLSCLIGLMQYYPAYSENLRRYTDVFLVW